MNSIVSTNNIAYLMIAFFGEESNGEYKEENKKPAALKCAAGCKKAILEVTSA
jgi:hypothetical protein